MTLNPQIANQRKITLGRRKWLIIILWFSHLIFENYFKRYSFCRNQVTWLRGLLLVGICHIAKEWSSIQAKQDTCLKSLVLTFFNDPHLIVYVFCPGDFKIISLTEIECLHCCFCSLFLVIHWYLGIEIFILSYFNFLSPLIISETFVCLVLDILGIKLIIVIMFKTAWSRRHRPSFCLA